MTLLDDIRSAGEQRIAKAIAGLDRRHRVRILEAVARYGSVAAIPLTVWQDIQREIESETAAAILLLLLASDEDTARKIRRQGLEVAGVSGRGAVDYAAAAERRAQRMAAQATESLRRRLIETIDGQAAVMATKTQTEAARDMRRSVEEAFTPSRRERITRTTVVNSTSAGQIGAQRRASAGAISGDGAAVGTGGQSVRVELFWKNRPWLSKSGRSCPKCEAVDGQPERVWGLLYPSGPGDEAHLNCNCVLEPKVVVDRGIE